MTGLWNELARLKSTMSKHYPISSYDKYISLKMSKTMWAIMLFLLRPYVVSIASITNRKDKMFLINLFYSNGLALALGALAGIPALMVIYAWVKRKPDGPPVAGKIWRKGRLLLAISAALGAIVVFVPIWLGVGHRISVYGWVQFIASLSVVLVVYKSGYMKDCFSDWPDGAIEKK